MQLFRPRASAPAALASESRAAPIIAPAISAPIWSSATTGAVPKPLTKRVTVHYLFFCFSPACKSARTLPAAAFFVPCARRRGDLCVNIKMQRVSKTLDFQYMECLIHDLSALHFILKAHNGSTVGAVIPGHAIHVLKTALYCQVNRFRYCFSI